MYVGQSTDQKASVNLEFIIFLFQNNKKEARKSW